MRVWINQSIMRTGQSSNVSFHYTSIHNIWFVKHNILVSIFYKLTSLSYQRDHEICTPVTIDKVDKWFPGMESISHRVHGEDTPRVSVSSRPDSGSLGMRARVLSSPNWRDWANVRQLRQALETNGSDSRPPLFGAALTCNFVAKNTGLVSGVLDARCRTL